MGPTRQGPDTPNETLRTRLSDWQDAEVAQYLLSCSLGILPYDENHDSYRQNKALFWSNNPVGKGLHTMLMTMVHTAMLEYDEEEGQFRWNKSFALND